VKLDDLVCLCFKPIVLVSSSNLGINRADKKKFSACLKYFLYQTENPQLIKPILKVCLSFTDQEIILIRL